MSISTGDPHRSAPKKSTTAAATGGPADDAATPDEPVGGVLPVKKTTRAKSATGGAAGRTGSGGRTPANGSSRTASSGTGAAKSTGNGAKSTTAAKTTPAKAAAAPAKTATAKTTAAKAATKSAAPAKGKTAAPLFGGKGATAGGGKRATAGGGKVRRPVAPVRVAQSRNWGPILLYVLTGVVALGIIGISVGPVIAERLKGPWQDQVAGISGLVNYLDPASPAYDANLVAGNHQPGELTYAVTPPIGGPHNDRWQNCSGDVYTSEIAEEHAVHALEHGAVWVTYSPDLPQDQIDALASKVEGRDYMLMSPYPGLDSPISLQAWGFQLKVERADDSRIDDFINALRLNATQETGATCSGGITVASPTPRDV